MLKSRSQSSNNSIKKLNDKNKVESLFYKKLSLCSNQIVRYNYGGSPLWCHSQIPPLTTSTCPICPGCHSHRVYEMQLMPTLLSFLCNISSNSNGEIRTSADLSRSSTSSTTLSTTTQPDISSIESLSSKFIC